MPQKIDLIPLPFLTIRFADGITAVSRALAIKTTYDEGWLCGGPDTEWNARYLENLEQSCAEQYPGTAICIVPAEAETIEHTGRPPESAIQILPRIRLSAIFTNAAINFFDDEASPELLIVWHQDELTSLMSSEIETHLATLNWSLLTTQPEGA